MSPEELVKVNFGAYRPPIDAREAVVRLLTAVEPRYLAGLGSVVLGSHQSFNRSRRRGKTRSRGRKVAYRDANGLYFRAWRGEPASIELFVDSILRAAPRPFRRLRFVQNLALGHTLFHELGHHIHATQARQHAEKEDVAEAWRRRLSAAAFPRLHPRLAIALRFLRPALYPLLRWLMRFHPDRRRQRE